MERSAFALIKVLIGIAIIAIRVGQMLMNIFRKMFFKSVGKRNETAKKFSGSCMFRLFYRPNLEELEGLDLMSAFPMATDPTPVLQKTIIQMQTLLQSPQTLSASDLMADARSLQTNTALDLSQTQASLATAQQSLVSAQNGYGVSLDAIAQAHLPEKDLATLSATLAATQQTAAALPRLSQELAARQQSVQSLNTSDQNAATTLQILMAQKAALDTALAQANAALLAATTPAPAPAPTAPLSAAATARLAAIDAEKADLTRNIANNTIGITAIGNDIRTLTTDRARYFAAGDPYYKQIDLMLAQKNTVLAPIKAQVDTWNARITQLNAEAQTIRGPVVAPPPAPASAATIKALTDQKTQKAAQVAAAATSIATAQTTKNGLDAQLAAARSALTAKQKELDTATAAQALVPTQQAQVTAAQKKVTDAQPVIAGLTAQLAANGATVDSLKAQVAGLTSLVATKQAAADEAKKVADALQAGQNAGTVLNADRVFTPKHLSPFQLGAAAAEEQAIMTDLVYSGHPLDAFLPAVLDGAQREEQDAINWDLYSDAVHALPNGGPGTLTGDLMAGLDLRAGQEEMQAVMQQDIGAQLAALVQAQLNSTDAVTLGGTPAGTDESKAVGIALPHLGGTLTLTTVNGALPLPSGLSLMPATDAANLLGSPDPSAPAPAVLSSISGITMVPYPVDMSRWFTLPGIGSVLADSNGGHPWNYQQEGSTVRLLTIQNGSIASTTSQDPSQTTINRGSVFIHFWDEHFVSSINVKLLEASGNAQLSVIDPNGVVTVLPVDGSGSIKVGRVIVGFTLTSLSASYGVESIDTRPLTPAPGWEGLGMVAQVSGAGSWLDFTTAGHLVTEAGGKAVSSNPNDVITAHYYQGSTEVSSQVIGPDGLWSAHNATGFSSVVFRHTAPGSPLYLAGISLKTDGSPQDPSWAAVSNQNNRDASLATAKHYENSTVYKDVPNLNLNQMNGMGGEDIIVTGSMKMEIGNNFPDEYQRIEFHGDAAIRRLLYVNENGISEVPADHYQILTGNVVILYPGSPRRIVTELVGNGKISAPLFAAHGQEMKDVMPSQSPVLSADWLYWNASTGNEGWRDVPSTVSTRTVVAMPGSILGSLWRISNDGLQGVDITVIVHVGPTGSSADPVQKVFTGTLGGMQEKALSVNVGIGQEGDTVSLEVIRSDGVSISYGHRTQAARSTDIRVVNPETGQLEWKDQYALLDREAQLRFARLYLKIGAALGDSIMQASALALVDAATPNAQQIAYSKLTNLPIVTEANQQNQANIIAKDIFKGEERLDTARRFISDYSPQIVEQLSSTVSLEQADNMIAYLWNHPESIVSDTSTTFDSIQLASLNSEMDVSLQAVTEKRTTVIMQWAANNQGLKALHYENLNEIAQKTNSFGKYLITRLAYSIQDTFSDLFRGLVYVGDDLISQPFTTLEMIGETEGIGTILLSIKAEIEIAIDKSHYSDECKSQSKDALDLLFGINSLRKALFTNAETIQEQLENVILAYDTKQAANNFSTGICPEGKAVIQSTITYIRHFLNDAVRVVSK